MWPWEHAAVGYLLYWVLLGRRARPVDHAAALAVVFGTQFPDLVDKPLSWWLQVLPTGQSLAHSLLVAVPLVVLVTAVAAAAGRTRVGLAFGIGYLAHLPGDVLYPVLIGGQPSVGFLLYPLVPVEPYAVAGVGVRLQSVVENVLPLLRSPAGVAYVAGDLLLVGLAAVVWYRDGCPGLALLRRWLPDRSAPTERPE